MPELQDHVFGAEIVNEPLDATVTPAFGELRSEHLEATTDDDDVQLNAGASGDCVHLDLQADLDNAGDVLIGDGTTFAVRLAGGQSWSVLTRFLTDNLIIRIEEDGDSVRAVWFERVT